MQTIIYFACADDVSIYSPHSSGSSESYKYMQIYTYANMWRFKFGSEKYKVYGHG